MPGRPLSKSRYRLGLECPTKIFYSLHRETYLNRNGDNDFLMALAEGGFQVGELARCMHMPGETVESLAQEDALSKTAQLWQQDPVTIFEAAFAARDCFIRADIVRKHGKVIDLIEVKSKSVDPDEDDIFVGKRGGIKAEWVPYLHDIAFQTFVTRSAMPDYSVQPYLMLADKSAVSPIDGLNSYFLLDEDDCGRASAHMPRALPQEALDEPVLRTIDVGDLVESILAATYDGMSFGERVASWAAASKDARMGGRGRRLSGSGIPAMLQQLADPGNGPSFRAALRQGMKPRRARRRLRLLVATGADRQPFRRAARPGARYRAPFRWQW